MVLAIVNALTKERRLDRHPHYDEYSEILREAAKAEQDPFYRYLMNEVVDNFDQLRAKSPALDSFDDIFNLFGSMMDDLDDDDDFDEEPCNCYDCRRARGEI